MSWWTSITSRFQRKADPTYPIAAQFFTPGQPIWTSKDFRSYVSQGYRRCGTVYTCINKIAGAAAGINWKLYTDRTMTREIPSHPILDLWHRPNPRMGGASFMEQVFGYWHLSGNAYIYANRLSPNEGPVELWPLRPDLMKIVAGDSDINGYVYGYGTGRARDFDPEQIMHLRFPSYDDEWYGLSPIEVAMELVDQQNEGNAWNTALMQNAGKPASVFFTKGYLTVEQRSQVRQELLKRYSGKRNAGTPLVLEADMTWQSMSMSPYELDWLQSRELNTRDIAAIFDVAPELVGDSAGKTFANQKEAKQSLYTENVLPKLDRVADHANSWLVPMYPDLAKSGAYLGYDRKDIEVLAEIYTAAQQQLSEQATELWNSGQTDLYTVQQMQGVKPDPNGKGIYKVGAILLRSQDLQAYAEQALQKPAAPPMPQAEPLNIPAPTNQPAQPTNEEPPDDENQNGKTPAKEKRRLTPDRKVLDLASREEKTAYAAKMEADRARWETTIESRLQSYFDDERKAVVKAINACSTEDELDHAVQSALSSQSDTLEQLIYQAWMDVSVDIGGQVAATLAGEKGILSDFIKLFSSNQLKYLLNIAGTKIKEINQITLARVRMHLAVGVAQGESIPKLAKRIDSLYLDEIIPNRSATIARTEVISSSNWSSQQAAKQSGLTLNKVWLATEDGRTRPAHADADGQKVGMDEPFVVDGEELQYPGDPSGSAANVINCFPGDTPVAAQGIQAATRRWYEGELVEITTSLGDKLSGTPNHPILTDRGWVALGMLQEGDSVVSSGFTEKMTFGDFDVQDKPALIGEVFNALSEVGMIHRMGGVHVDFHGDGLDSDVEIVSTSSQLRDNIGNTAISEPLNELLLSSSNLGQTGLLSQSLTSEPFIRGDHSFSGNVSGVCEGKTLVGTSLIHTQIHTLGAIAGSDTNLSQKSRDDVSSDSKVSGNSLDRHSTLIHRDSFTSDLGMLHVSNSDALVFNDSPTGFFDPKIGSSETDSKDVANFLQAFPSLVQLASITHVVRRPFSGHVYNLQTKNNWYISNGIVSHNCRCTQYYERVKSTNKVLTLAGVREYKSVRDFLEAMEA